MITRILVGLIGLVLLLPSIFYGGVLAVDLWVVTAMVLCTLEYTAMAFPDDRRASGAWMVVLVLSLAVAVLQGAELALGAAAVMVPAMFAFVIFRPGATLEAAVERLGRYALGVTWLGLLLTLALLRREESGLAWVLLVLTISWCGDTGGYFAGRSFGRRKLSPRVSPKKTWEGVLGGVVLSTVGIFVIRAVCLPQLHPVECLALGTFLTTAGVVGDLGESLLKRAFGVKDSGWIMPGHGGLLDRIDSVLFVAPLLYGYVVLVRG